MTTRKGNTVIKMQYTMHRYISSWSANRFWSFWWYISCINSAMETFIHHILWI